MLPSVGSSSDPSLRRQVGLRVAVLMAIGFALLFGASPAAAKLSWSGPLAPDTGGSGPALTSVACPGVGECVAVDVNGGEVTFDPRSPGPAAPTSIDSTVLTSVSCLSVSSCFAMDARGAEVSFDPRTPASAVATLVDPGQIPTSVSCLPSPSGGTCTAVDAGGNEVTFGPAAAAAPAGTTPHLIETSGAHVLNAVACPAPGSCTAVDSVGNQLTFDPRTGHVTGTSSSGNQNARSAIACLTTTACVSFDVNGKEYFPSGSPSVDPGHLVTSVACPPSATQCSLVDDAGAEITFTPGSGGSRVAINSTAALTSITCPATTLCVAVDLAGHAISFNPGAPSALVTALVDGSPSPYSAVACPAATQCTAADEAGNAVTFNPSSAGSAHTAVVDPGAVTIYSLACPAQTQCTGVDLNGREVTFNPQAPGTPTPVAMVHNPLLAVACPSSTQCTAVDDDRYEVTFNPRAPTTARYGLLGTPAGVSLTGVACPSSTLCTAVDAAGEAVSFNPQNPGKPRPVTILTASAVGVACPTTLRCIAVDAAGSRATFNPSSPAQATSLTIDGAQPSGLACPSATFCVVVDNAGRSVEFDPGGSGVTAAGSIPTSASLTGVTCVSAGMCVSIDSGGRGFVGSALVPAAPRARTAPAMTGAPRQGTTLTERHGSWSGAPTSYTHRWERCTGTARSCTPIPAATDARYKLVAADAGHTIRVTEEAANAGGFGVPVSAVPTTKVIGLPTVSRASLTGVGRSHPKLALTLTPGRYGPKLHQLSLSVPGGPRFVIVSSRHGRGPLVPAGISIRAGGKSVVFSARIVHGALTINLRRSVTSLRLMVVPPAVVTSAALARRVRRRSVKSLALVVSVPAPRRGTLRTRAQVKTS
jgi:hypothetical protein